MCVEQARFSAMTVKANNARVDVTDKVIIYVLIF